MPKELNVGTVKYCVLTAKLDELEIAASILRDRFDAVREGSEPVFENPKNPGKSRIVLATCGEMGHMPAAVRTSQIIHSYQPSVILFVGTCASLNPEKVQIGDVAIPKVAVQRAFEKVTEEGSGDYTSYESVKAFKEYFLDRSMLLPNMSTKDCSPKGLSVAVRADLSDVRLQKGGATEFHMENQNHNLREPRIHTDIDIFSCGMVLDSVEYREYLTGILQVNYRKIQVIDMESHGFFSAISASKDVSVGSLTEGLMIRGVSDYAGRKSETESLPEGWRETSLVNASLVACKLIYEMTLP